ncbi:25587_t:CDS:1 [Racocetra persica]|uniref:25587_t:CDS:1 n=1 Tax=Racocetra persica TaxID=160502 RepID=A0ACA9K966_9GLOM|nr:25587_t:CDS:1 [Racocetra persica]
MVHYEFTETVSDNGSEQELSIDSSPKEVYCEDCDKARSNGGKLIENKESFDHVKSLTETHVKLPFPPTIVPKDLVDALLLKSKSQSPKMLNEFFIYRKVFVQELRKQKQRLKMTRASKLASSSWHSESPKVKNEYRRLAREVEKLYIDAMKERLRAQINEKTDEQNKSFENIVNPTHTNSTIEVSDDFSNGNDKTGPSLPTEVKSCTSSEQYTNTNPCLDDSTFVPYRYPTLNDSVSDSYIQYQDNVYMPDHDGNMHLLDLSNTMPYMHLLDLSNTMPYSYQTVPFEFPVYSLQQNIQPNIYYIQDLKSYMTNENLSNLTNNFNVSYVNSYTTNITDFTSTSFQSLSVEESWADIGNHNNFLDNNNYYPTENAQY